MKTIKPIAIAAAVATSFLLSSRPVGAQDAPPPPPPDAPAAESAPSPQAQGQPQGQEGGGDRREQFRQRMNEHLKAALKVNDEEWGVIQPLLEKVQTKMRESMMSRFGGMGGGRRWGQGGGQGANANPSANNGGDRGNRPERQRPAEIEALQKALESEATSPEEIKTKLQALRDSRKKSAAELEQAQEDLRKVLTQRQEATLVMMGMLQ